LTIIEKAIRQVFAIQERLAVWEPATAVVLGAGPIGILATLVLRSMDIDVSTVARTPAPNPAATAIETSGGHYVSTNEESLAALKERIAPVDIVIESTGAGVMSHEAVRLLGRNGVVALLSISGGGGEIAVDADAMNRTLVLGNGVVLGSINAGREDWDRAVRDLDRFEELWPGLAASLITTRIPYDGDLGAIVRGGGDGIKTVVEFG
jgi:threonine dehydrogenase-like Zn-dependent dehydrogenase